MCVQSGFKRCYLGGCPAFTKCHRRWWGKHPHLVLAQCCGKRLCEGDQPQIRRSTGRTYHLECSHWVVLARHQHLQRLKGSLSEHHEVRHTTPTKTHLFLLHRWDVLQHLLDDQLHVIPLSRVPDAAIEASLRLARSLRIASGGGLNGALYGPAHPVRCSKHQNKPNNKNTKRVNPSTVEDTVQFHCRKGIEQTLVLCTTPLEVC